MRSTGEETPDAAVLYHQDLSPTMEKVHSEILDAFHRLTRQCEPAEEAETISCSVSPLAIAPHAQPRPHKSPHKHDDEDGNTSILEPNPEPLTGCLLEASGPVCPPNLQSRFSKAQRRLSEAALFFDAVGEIPPVRVCEWENLIADDDDDENEDFYPDSVSATEDLLDADLEPRISEKEDSTCGVRVDVPPERVPSDVSEPSSPSGSPPPPRQRRRRSESLPKPFLHRLPPPVEKSRSSDSFYYRGLQVNPPEAVFRGTSRGNFSSLHRKAWLESADPKHRYGKNLRLYYRHWESLGFPADIFFDWLDARGEAEGDPLPELAECPRVVLDEDRVLYISDMDTTMQYALSIVPDEMGRGVVLNAKNERVRTGPDGWIFVLRDGILYGARKVARVTADGCETIRFHHSSFFGGKAVAAAGIFVTDDTGILKQTFPHSGHYRPGEAEVQRILFYYFSAGVDLRSLEVDIQQIVHLARQRSGNNTANCAAKEKKRNSLYLRPATVVADYLCHKARFIGLGIFSQIHLLREPITFVVSSGGTELISADRPVARTLQ